MQHLKEQEAAGSKCSHIYGTKLDGSCVCSFTDLKDAA